MLALPRFVIDKLLQEPSAVRYLDGLLGYVVAVRQVSLITVNLDVA